MYHERQKRKFSKFGKIIFKAVKIGHNFALAPLWNVSVNSQLNENVN
jgi:uncharacterized protein YlbG (UPF0298 family)